MASIRYICLSDMHLGEEDSLLTNLKTASNETDPLKPSPVLERLVDCLKYLFEKTKPKKKPTLVLNGDILEFALATDDQAAMAFERFIDLIMPAKTPMFEKIIYIPGNHDHHLWESARETQYVNYLGSGKFPPGSFLPAPWHVTNIFIESGPNAVPAYFLTRLVKRYPHLKDFVITAAYPNFGVRNKDGSKFVFFHHGHFTEPIYLLMSSVKNLIFENHPMPEYPWDVEAENFAWIDFFWSALGRSGKAGQDVEVIYDKMRDKGQFKKLLYNFAENLAREYDLPGWGDKMEALLLKGVFSLLVDKIFERERHLTKAPLSEKSETQLRWYMNGPVHKHLLKELKIAKLSQEVTFVFGHTHKPFQKDMNFTNFPGWVNVYNSGGWVVDTVVPEPLHGGAVILFDEDLNGASLRMYNENHNLGGYNVHIAEASHTRELPNPFCQALQKIVKSDQDPWKSFSTAVARAVHVREENLRAKIFDNV